MLLNTQMQKRGTVFRHVFHFAFLNYSHTSHEKQKTTQSSANMMRPQFVYHYSLQQPTADRKQKFGEESAIQRPKLIGSFRLFSKTIILKKNFLFFTHMHMKWLRSTKKHLKNLRCFDRHFCVRVHLS